MKSLLVVDDNETLAYFTAMNLKRELSGITAVIATSCEQARNIARHNPPSVVIVDARLPDGDGLDLIREFLEEFEGVVPILISGHAPTGSEKDHVFEFIAKPYEVDLLIGTVKRALSKNPDSAEPPEPAKKRPPLPVSKAGECDPHHMLNRLASLLTGLKAFGADVKEHAGDREAVHRTVDEYLDRLCGYVNDVADSLRKGKE